MELEDNFNRVNINIKKIAMNESILIFAVNHITIITVITVIGSALIYEGISQVKKVLNTK